MTMMVTKVDGKIYVTINKVCTCSSSGRCANTLIGGDVFVAWALGDEPGAFDSPTMELFDFVSLERVVGHSTSALTSLIISPSNA
jgi:hypothetical protein